MNKAPRNETPGNMNGGLNGGMQNMSPEALLEQIRALSFVRVELELFLDTHPKCQQALDYYARTVDALEKYTERYHETVGPLVASGAINPDTWTWVDTPWPWQAGNGAVKGGNK